MSDHPHFTDLGYTELGYLMTKVGLDNARILLARHNQHEAGLNLAFEISSERYLAETLTIGPGRNVYTPPDAMKFLGFDDQMKAIEQANKDLPMNTKRIYSVTLNHRF